MGRAEALLLGGLFLTQFLFTNEAVRWGYGGAYCALAVVKLVRDVPRLGLFRTAVRDSLRDPQGVARRDREGRNGYPPDPG